MVIATSLIFLLVEMFLEVSASYSVSGLYRGVWYQPVEHHTLLGQSFMNISGISVVRCSVRCLSHHGCFSFNYDLINQVCQMNNATGGQICENFLEMFSVSYYDATASTMTCQVCVQYIYLKNNKMSSFNIYTLLFIFYYIFVYLFIYLFRYVFIYVFLLVLLVVH